MKESNRHSAIFKEYPDVLNAKQVSQLLGVSTKTVYRLLHEGTLDCLKVGREYRVSKINVMRYVRVFNTKISESANE